MNNQISSVNDLKELKKMKNLKRLYLNNNPVVYTLDYKL